MLPRDVRSDESTEGVSDQRDRCAYDAVDEVGGVSAVVLDEVGTGRPRRLAVAALVQRIDAEEWLEALNEVVPRRASAAEPVQQQDWRSPGGPATS